MHRIILRFFNYVLLKNSWSSAVLNDAEKKGDRQQAEAPLGHKKQAAAE